MFSQQEGTEFQTISTELRHLQYGTPRAHPSEKWLNKRHAVAGQTLAQCLFILFYRIFLKHLMASRTLTHKETSQEGLRAHGPIRNDH